MNMLFQKNTLNNVDAYLLTSNSARTYATGFVSSAGYVVVTKDGVYLAVDFRYYEMAQNFLKKNPKFNLLPLMSSIDDNIIQFVKEKGIKNLGFEDDSLPVRKYEKIKEYLDPLGTKLFPSGDIIWKIRSLKSEEEIENIKAAQRLTEKAFDFFLSIVKPGVSEKYITFEVEKFIRTNGGELAFDTIGISGKNTSLCHGVPSDRIIEKSDVFLLDFGAKVNNYCSDMTRVVSIGKPSNEISDIYKIVLEANLAAIDAVRSGMTGKQLDNVARSIIEKYGYGDNFAHSLGHGIGIECHELPVMGPKSDDIVEEMSVFTIEPGIYLAGKFGIRIEDMVFVQDGKAKVITKTSKEIIII